MPTTKYQYTQNGKRSTVSADGFNIQTFAKMNPNTQFRMVDAEGNTGFVPANNVEQAQKDGLRLWKMSVTEVAPKKPSKATQTAHEIGNQMFGGANWGKLDLTDKRLPYQRLQDQYNEQLSENPNASKAARESAGQKVRESNQRRAQQKANLYGVQSEVDAERMQRIEDFQKGINGDAEAAKRAGVTQTAQMLADDYDYSLERGRDLTSNIPFTAPTLARTKSGDVKRNELGEPIVGYTTEGQRVNAYNREQNRRTTQRFLNDLVGSKIDEAEKKAVNQFLDEKRKSIMPQDDMQGILDARRLNELNDPQKILDDLKNNLGDILSNETTRARIESDARSRGMSMEDYTANVLMPAVSEHLETTFREKSMDKYLPKNAGEYIIQGLADSVLGGLTRQATMTKSQKELYNEAQARTAEGSNPYYTPGTLAEVGRFGVGLAADQPVFSAAGVVAGRIVNAATKGYNAIRGTRIAEQLFGKALPTTGDITAKYGNRTAGILNFLNANTSSTSNIAKTIAPNVMRSGTSLGLYEDMRYLTSEAPDAMQEEGFGIGDFISQLGERFKGGFETGAMFGTGSTITGNLASKVGITGTEKTLGQTLKHGTQKLAARAAGFAVEAELFKAKEQFEAWRQGKEVNFVQDLAEGAGMAIMTKITGIAPRLGKFNAKEANPQSLKKGMRRFAEGFMKFGSANYDARLKLTTEEREEFLNKTKANGLYDAVEKGIDLQDVGTTLPVITDGIQDFLSDKSISWSLRNKFALAMGETMSAARPRMESTRITNTGKRYSVSEYGAENELLSQKNFKNEEDAKVYEAGLQMKRSSQDTRNSLWDAHFLNEQETKDALSDFLESINIDKNDPDSVVEVIEAMNNPESDLGKFWNEFRTRRTASKGQEVENAIKVFESENRLKEGDLNKLVSKDPLKLTPQEKDILDRATEMLKKFTYKDGELHPEQSEQDGRTVADRVNLSSDNPNGEPAKVIQEELDMATAALNEAFNANEGLKTDVTRMLQRGERPSEVLSQLVTYSEEERGVVADYFNAQAKYEGFLAQTHKKIEDRVQAEVERRTFKGTVNGEPDTENMVIVSDGVKMYAVVAGNILADKDGNITGVEDAGGLIIAISDNSDLTKSFTEQVASSELVSLSPSHLRIVGREKLSDFRERYLSEKEADASEAMGAKEPVLPEEQQNATAPESAGKESEQETVSGETPVEAVNGSVTSKETESIPLGENGRTKLYHLVDTQTAIDDILKQPESKIVKGNNDPGIVAQRRINDAKSRIKGLDSKLGKRFETQDFTEEEAEDIIAMEQGEEPVTNMGKYARERIAIENEISYYDNLKKTWEQRKAAEQQARSMASGNEPSKADELTETEFRNDKENTDNEQSESQGVVENEPDETTWDDMVKTSAGRKTLLENETNGVRLLNKAKKIYGDLLDSDLTIANDIYELVAMNLPKGISWEGREGIRGLQEELGSQFKRGIGRGADTNAFNSYLAKKGEGISIDAAIHRIWESNENMLPNGEHRYDDTEIRDAVIDMFTSASKPSDITNYVIKSRIADAERNLQAEEEMMLNYLRDEAVGRKFDSAEEMMDYNDLVENSFKSLMAEDLDAIKEIFAENELYLQSTKGKEYEQRREESPVTEGAGMDSEPSRGRAEGGTAEGNRTQQPEESRGLQETGEERIAQREEGSDSPDRSLYRKGEQSERLKPRDDAERSVVASAEEKLAEDIANQEKKVREAKQKWDDAIANASGKADLFGADDAVTEQGSMFSNSEMGYDASEESLRRTASQEESAYRQEQARLEQLRSQQEHDSRIAGALENARGEQKIDFEGGSTGVIQGLEGYKEKDITDLVEQHFKDVLEGEDAQIVGMKVIGSRTTGKAREDSDLDVLLEYTGKAREDDLFNALNEEPLVIEGITVDINPITKGKSGTIEQFLKRNGFKDDAEPLELSLESPETNEKKGEKIVDTVSSNTEKIEDFGQKIGAAKKDLAKSGFERKKGSEDSRPAWQKKYTRVNVDKEGNEDIISPFDPSKPFVAYYLSKNNGRQRTNYVRGEHYERKVFNSEEEFDTILPVWEAQQQGYRVMEDKENGGFLIARRASTGKLVEYNHFDTREDATAYLASPEGATELLSRKRENFGIPNLEHLTRNNMPDYRNGRDVTGDDFLNDFGFRGGEFGNWVNTSERQNFLNLAYDSLRDLAETIGISPKALSLGGELSIAFGARGSAGAKAHYEPGRAVINLTKMDGAGSLAHEWAHALDNYFGLQTVGRERTRNVDNLKNNDIFITEGVWGVKTRMEVRDAFNELVKAMREKKVTQQISVETAKKQADKANSRYDGEIKRYREQFERGRSTYKYNRKTKQSEVVTFKPTEEQLRQYDELVRQLLTDDTFIFDYVPSKGGYRMGGQTAQKLYELVKDVIPNKKETYGPLHNLAYYAEKVKQAEDYLSRAERGEEETLTQKTDFLADSEGFDKGRAKNYWSTKIEMFARGLESYVARKMAKEAKSSDYLTYEKGSVYESLYGHSLYPKGEDAKNVDKAFDKLFSIIQEKEVDGKRLLYRTSGNANRGKFSLNDASDTVEDEGKGVNLQTLAYRSYTNRAGKKVEGLYERINRLEREVVEARNGVVSQSDATRQEATGVGAEASASRKVAQKASVRDNQNRLTLLEKQLEEAKAERDNRFVEAANLRRKYSITPDGKISTENLERLFKDHNSNPVIGQLFDKVNSVIKNLGVDFRVNWNTTEPGARGVSRMSGSIGYDIDALARNIPAQDKAKTLLHEMIHQGTQAVLFAYRTKVGRAALSPELLTAARELNAIYDAVKKASPKGKNGLEMYGVKNVDEMVAELANPEFREALKNINYDGRTLWQKFKDCIHLIFGGKADKNALSGADKALDDILDNFSQGVYDGGKRIAKVYESLIKHVFNATEHLNRYSPEEDPETLKRLEKDEKVKVYRAMQVIDGKLYPPMAAAVNGELVRPVELGEWEKADEHPELINVSKNAKGEDIYKFVLDKGGKDATGRKATDVTAAYNPYIHTSRSPLNDQFKSAWIRPNLVTVEVEVPKSELSSGYKAQYAKDSVGEVDWKSGVVTSELVKQGKPSRKVILSRWDKPIRVVPESEVAVQIAKMMEGTQVGIPENVVTPKLRSELEKLGVKIGEPEKGVKKSEQIADALKSGLSVDNTLASEFAASNAPKSTTSRRVRNYTANIIRKLRKAGVNVQVATLDEVKRKMEELDYTPSEIQAALEASTFYSPAEKAVENIKQNKATGEQWLKMIEKNGGLKKEEDKWMGLSDFLKDKKSVTKDELLNFIRENQIQVEEVNYSSRRVFNDEGKVESDGPINATRLEYTTEGLENKREIALVVPSVEPYNEHDEVHFGDAGGGRAVAWIRFGETTDKDGKKVLVIDEIQSKRHQDGRDNGYYDASLQGTFDTAEKAYGDFLELLLDKYNVNSRNQLYDYLTPREQTRLNGLELEMVQAQEELGEVPDAPFRKNWHELAMKRMLRYAAENGYDKVAWTTGEQQANRYDLSAVVDHISYIITKDGYIDARAYFKNGNYHFIGETWGEIEKNIGKDLANRMRNGDSDRTERLEWGFDGNNQRVHYDYNVISGDGLKIGGEGMKGFYDQMLPKFMDKYGKKWGVKTYDIELPDLERNGLTMHSVDVTPDMKRSVMFEGQPEFMRTGQRGDAEFLRTKQGIIYGWHDKDGIHLTEDGFNPDTPVHEYTHGYMLMLKDKDSALYEKVVKALKDSDVWKEVINDEAYKTIWNNETRIASEVASRLAGRESGNRAEREGIDMDNPLSVLNFAAASYRVKRALQEFWEWVQTNVFGIEKPMDAERFVNMVLRDLHKGVNPEADIEGDRPNEHQFIGRFGAEDADKADGDTQRIRNLGIAESMEKSGKDARQIKAATGWERGKDGLWRYEIVDFKDIDILGNRLWRKANPVTEADIKRYGSLRKKRTGAKSGYRAKLSENEELELEDLKNLINPEDTMKDKDALTLEDFIDAPELFKAYPEVRDIKVEYTDLNNEFSGMWNHDDTIFLEEDYIKRMSYYGKARLERELRSVLLHEIQHAIQELEGFAEGDNPYRITDNGKELGEEGYFHSAGEVEATNVESRKDMTLKERRNSLAEETEKYPRTVQHIYRWNEDTVNNENAASGRIRNTGRRETDEIINGHIDKVISSLHSEANKVNSLDEITTPDVKNDIETRIKRGEQVYGWYDKATGKVNLYMPNIKNRYIAEQTIWHETVGHKGMRELLGENGYRACMRNLYTGEGNIALREFVKNELPKNGFSLYDAIDEYLASEAEKGHGQLSLWQKVKKNLTDALHEAGYEMNPSISDVKYLVWLSKNHIQDADPMSEARRYRILRKLELEKYYQPTTDGKAYTKDGEDAFGVQYRIDSNDGDTPLSYNARKRYEDELYKSTFVWDEAHHDYMAAFRHLQEAIANGREIPDHMNAYMIENEMDSKIKAVGDIYIRDYCEPLQEAINECLPELDADAQKAYNMLERYMYMKHGLERNREFIVRDRINEMRDTERRLREENFNATLQGNNDLFPMERRETRSDRTQREWDELKEQSYKKLSRGEFDFGEYLDALDDFIDRKILSGYEPDKNDKSGLTGLMGDEGGFSDAKAVMSVKDTEAMLGKNKVDALWEKMNAVTQYGVEVEYASGLISKANRDHVNKMFNWYLPLRKYNDATVTDMYSYINGPHGDFLGKTLMQAGGRHSQAELPIANALAMGENAIRRAARNEVRKAFLRFSREFKSDLVSETESWIRNEGTKENPDWVVAYPEIREGASPDEIAEAVDMFKKTMAELSAQGMARKVANALTVPYRINSSRVKSEHIVDVYVNGDIHHLVVNGNPRAAQAINGLLRPETNHQKIAAFMRFMSQTYTSWAPTFMARNAIRDAGFASSMLSVKEGWGYTKDFAANYARLTTPVNVPGNDGNKTGVQIPPIFTLFSKYRKGTLDTNDRTQRYFKEFVENGGVTGYIQENNAEHWQKEILKGVRRVGENQYVGWTKDTAKTLKDALDHFGESIENAARFATYMTSRQNGRTIVRSVSDAKEVSVNFNRKGAGAKTASFKNREGKETRNAWIAATTAQYLRTNTLFYNATVQSIMNAFTNAKKRPGRFISRFALPPILANIGLTFFNQWLHYALDEDDKEVSDNPYSDLPEYTRRNNICLYLGHGNWLYLPLSIEHRSFYGLGDIAMGLTYDKRMRSTDRGLAADILSQLSSFSPVDYADSEIGMKGVAGYAAGMVVPAYAKPVVNAYFNTRWTGVPIQREGEWNKYDPEYKKAFGSTSPLLIDASKTWHEWWGGNEIERAGVAENSKIKEWVGEVSPGKTQYAVEQMGGEPLKIIMGAMSILDSDNELNTRNIPVLKAFIGQSDQQSRFYQTKARFYNYLDEFAEVEKTESKLKKEEETDPLMWIEHNIRFEEEPRVKRYRLYNESYKPVLDDINAQMKKAARPEQKKALQALYNSFLEQTVNVLEDFED